MKQLEIRSAANPRFRELVALSTSARERAQRQIALIEGEHLALAWLEAGGFSPLGVVLPRRSVGRPSTMALCERFESGFLILDDALYDRLSQVEHGPGPIVLIPIPEASAGELSDEDTLYLDGIQDPGNVGSLLRSAAAFGVRRVIASPATADLWSPKVLRSAMGAHFCLNLAENVSELAVLKLSGKLTLTAADPGASQRIDQADLCAARVWIFGSEGRGLSETFKEAPEVERLRIHHHSQIESLNVAMAASVCLYEQYRQRLLRTLSA